MADTWMLLLMQCREGVKGIDRMSYGPYLYALSPDVLAVLTMHGEYPPLPPLSSGHNPCSAQHQCLFSLQRQIVLVQAATASLLHSVVVTDCN